MRSHCVVLIQPRSAKLVMLFQSNHSRLSQNQGYSSYIWPLKIGEMMINHGIGGFETTRPRNVRCILMHFVAPFFGRAGKLTGVPGKLSPLRPTGDRSTQESDYGGPQPATPSPTPTEIFEAFFRRRSTTRSFVADMALAARPCSLCKRHKYLKIGTISFSRV